MTDKRDPKDVPECEHGYWGGFSPKRRGQYVDQHLTKQFQNGRARIYPDGRRIPGSLKKMLTPKRADIIPSDPMGDVEKSSSPISVFKISTTNEKANFELEKMRIE